VPAPLTRSGAHRPRRWAAPVLPRASAGLALALACVLGTPRPAVALASTRASLQASLTPERPGAQAALTVTMRFTGGAEGIPEPLRGFTLHLPAGLSVSFGAGATCSGATLRRRGAAGCPAAALLGRGRARLQVHAGSQTIPEPAVLWAFRGRSASGSPTLEMLGEGSTPLNERTVSRGLLRSEGAPFGSRLIVTIPPIPTVALEPDASFDSLSLTLGNPRGPARARAPGARIRVPRHCPSGGFPFAAELAFSGAFAGHAASTVPCP
jgi:hypothetical protein